VRRTGGKERERGKAEKRRGLDEAAIYWNEKHKESQRYVNARETLNILNHTEWVNPEKGAGSRRRWGDIDGGP